MVLPSTTEVLPGYPGTTEVLRTEALPGYYGSTAVFRGIGEELVLQHLLELLQPELRLHVRQVARARLSNLRPHAASSPL
jgi:hypothetical protein